MAKINFKEELKHLYNPSAREIAAVKIPKMNFLMIDGKGNPNTAQEYKDAVEALFSVSYALKFQVKREKGLDYGVLPLESLWWVDDMTEFTPAQKDKWKWTSMIMQPKSVKTESVNNTFEQVEKKKNLPALSKMRFESFLEGLSAQIMHIGPYSAEGPTIEKLHAFIKKKGYELRGRHHEIFLSDPRRSKPERLKTIIRQPMK